jgi:hypothetical protein
MNDPRAIETVSRQDERTSGTYETADDRYHFEAKLAQPLSKPSTAHTPFSIIQIDEDTVASQKYILCSRRPSPSSHLHWLDDCSKRKRSTSDHDDQNDQSTSRRRRCHALRAHSACLPACRLSAQIPLYWSHTQESLFQILSSLQKCLASSGSKVSWLLAYRTHSACHRLAPAKHDEYIRQQFSGFIKKTSKTKSILNLCIHRLHLR